MEHIIAQRGGFEISTDPVRLDLDLVCGVLAKTYWAEGIARDAIEESIRNALAFGLYGVSSEGAIFDPVIELIFPAMLPPNPFKLLLAPQARSCNARSVHTSGSFADIRRCRREPSL